MTNDHDFQKRLAKLQIQASAVTTIGGILMALGFSAIAFPATIQNYSSIFYPWNGFIFLWIGVAFVLYHLFSIKKKIDELK